MKVSRRDYVSMNQKGNGGQLEGVERNREGIGRGGKREEAWRHMGR